MSIDTKELRRIAMEYWANDSKISLYPKEVIDICDTLDRQSAEIEKLKEKLEKREDRYFRLEERVWYKFGVHFPDPPEDSK